MAEVNFYYNSNNIIVQCNKYDKMKEIIKKFLNKIGTNQNSFVYIYNGNIITKDDLTFNEISNTDDKNRNKINILVSKATNSNFSEFIYENCLVKDQSMKDYAEMVILYALKNYPDDDHKKCVVALEKFEEKYGGLWSASFIKNGDSAVRYYDYDIKVKYAGYTIKIARTRAD